MLDRSFAARSAARASLTTLAAELRAGPLSSLAQLQADVAELARFPAADRRELKTVVDETAARAAERH